MKKENNSIIHKTIPNKDINIGLNLQISNDRNYLKGLNLNVGNLNVPMNNRKVLFGVGLLMVILIIVAISKGAHRT